MARALPAANVSNPAPTAQASIFLQVSFMVCSILFFYYISQTFRAGRGTSIRHAGFFN
jgi:hypothetical protein